MLEFILKPWCLVILPLTFYINRKQQRIIENLEAESQVLSEKLEKRRIALNDFQRRQLAVKGKALGRRTRISMGPCRPIGTGFRDAQPPVTAIPDENTIHSGGSIQWTEAG